MSKNVKQALLTLLHVLTVRYARKYRVGLGHERGRCGWNRFFWPENMAAFVCLRSALVHH